MKENRKPGRMAVDLLLIFIVFLVIQMVVNGLVTLVYVYLNHVDAAQFAQQVASGQQGQFVAATSVLSSLLTIMVYPRLRWTPLDRSYLRSRPWATLVWCGLLTLGTILPFEWVYEQLQIQMADSHQALFESVMREPWGYVALGILAPVAEAAVEASTFKVGDKLLITGNTTGAMYVEVKELHGDHGEPITEAEQGTRVAFSVPGKVRPNDKLFRIDQRVVE